MQARNAAKTLNSAFIRNIAWTAAGTILPLGAAVVSIPVLIDTLGAAKFGLLAIAWTIVGYFSLFDLGIGKALTKLVAERIDTDLDPQIPCLISASFWMLLALGSCTSLLLWFSSDYIAYELLDLSAEITEDTATTFRILSIAVPMVLFATCLKGVLEAYNQFRLVSLVRMPLGIANYSGPALIASFVSQDLSDMVIVLLVARMLAIGAYLILCSRHVPHFSSALSGRKIDLMLFGSLLKFGGWMTISYILGPLLQHLGRFFIVIVLSAEAVAYFVTPYEMAVRLLLIPGILVTVLFPYFSKTNSTSLAKSHSAYVKSNIILCLTMGPLCLLGAVYSRQVLTLWIDGDFASHSHVIAQILFIGVFVNSFGHLSQSFIQSLGRPDATAKLHILEFFLYAPYLWWLVNNYQVEGAAIAWLIRVALSTCMLWIICRLIYSDTRRLSEKSDSSENVR